MHQLTLNLFEPPNYYNPAPSPHPQATLAYTDGGNTIAELVVDGQRVQIVCPTSQRDSLLALLHDLYMEVYNLEQTYKTEMLNRMDQDRELEEIERCWADGVAEDKWKQRMEEE